MAPTVPVAEATVAAELRDKIAPTLASAVQSAMHDQPSDVAGYFAQLPVLALVAHSVYWMRGHSRRSVQSWTQNSHP